jgi:NADPH:quinone reductase-like Zn-dependent oxidoreductase
MRAIVRKNYGGPEQLELQDRPEPEMNPGSVLIRVRALGLNHAEIYFRMGLWGDVAEISGIECVGEVKADPAGRLEQGQKVLALMGGMGRTINGSYAEYVNVPSGVHLSFFASAFMFGTPEYPLSAIPFQEFVNHAESGRYRAKPAKIFRLEEMQNAHRLMEAGQANGKIVVTLRTHHHPVLRDTMPRVQRTLGALIEGK